MRIHFCRSADNNTPELKILTFDIQISPQNQLHIRKYFSMSIRGPDGLDWRNKIGDKNLMTLFL